MSMFNKVTKSFQWGQHKVTLETGEIARQSTAPFWSISKAPSCSPPWSRAPKPSRARISFR